jgi:hypothetical protein
MEIFVQGKGKETLDKRHYVSAGGEGSIYTKNGIAYKIYLKPSHMIPDTKIRELSVLTDPNIIKPESIILDASNKKIGYTMRYVTNTVSLCQIFTKAFKDRNSIKPKNVLGLVNKLRDGIEHCHSKNILIVDLNELNFLVNGDKFDTVYFIDVDSYQTPSYPATAIMDSIRDRHASKWTKETDWFSFGIIAFQMFIGMHPFKGKHATLKTLDDRMYANMSVFDPAVGLPPTAASLKSIPESYRDWFKMIFGSNMRSRPPFDSIVVIAPTTVKTITGTDRFMIQVNMDFAEDVVYYGGVNAVLTTGGLYINNKLDTKVASYAHVVTTPKLNHTVTAIVKDRFLSLYDASTGIDIECSIKAEQLMTYGKRLYVKQEDNIFEIEFLELNQNKITAAMTVVCNILPNATRVFDGVVIQDLLGAKFASIFPESKNHYQVKIPQLNDYRIMDAKYENNVLVVIGEKKGKYDQFIIKFDKDDFSEYNLIATYGVTYSGINFTVLDNGICVMINPDGEVELFHNRKDSLDVKLIKDTTLADGKLFHEGNTTLLARGNTIYSIKLK